jgi:hypothetical protein
MKYLWIVMKVSMDSNEISVDIVMKVSMVSNEISVDSSHESLYGWRESLWIGVKVSVDSCKSLGILVKVCNICNWIVAENHVPE